MVAARIHGPSAVTGRWHEPARIAASSQGGSSDAGHSPFSVRLEREQDYVGNDNDPGHFGEESSNFGVQFPREVLMQRPHRMNRGEDLAVVAKMSPSGFSSSAQKH